MSKLPETYQKLMIEKLSEDFRDAVNIVVAEMYQPEKDEVCIKNRYVGLNADDINVTTGKYLPRKIPCGIGFEGIGEVVAVGSDVKHLNVGDKAAYFTAKYNAYGEYSCVPALHAFKVPEIKPEYLVLVVSGLTASIGLNEVGRLKEGEKVLITAAAGGLGHIAVQLAKIAKCHVIGTCSNDEKGNILKRLGCDRVINYSKEDLATILKEEYPDGIDIVWETIGGKVLQTCLQNLAIRGRIIIVGGISGYKRDSLESQPRIEISFLPDMVWFSSKSVQGFNMENYPEFYSLHFYNLQRRVDCGEIRALYNVGCPEFTGMEGIINGIEYLYSGKSIGKIFVKIN